LTAAALVLEGRGVVYQGGARGVAREHVYSEHAEDTLGQHLQGGSRATMHRGGRAKCA